ncbi:MAG: bacillithiol biosynthesis protein BshC, partial [Gemmatimonadales bacterium]
LYTVYKALSAVALARRLERERGVPVVPVFWLAGDDHDFVEANHAWVLNTAGDPVRIVLRERPADAPLVPLFREMCGADAGAALGRLSDALPDTEFKADVLTWLQSAYRPDANLADAAAAALAGLLGDRGGSAGLAIFRAHDRAAKRAAAPSILRGLDVTLPDGFTPVLIEGRAGRDRLRADGPATFVARRSGERFTRAELERIAAETPERLSPNVLLRPAVEAALFPTVAYVGGPAEVGYLPEAAPLFARLAVPAPAVVGRWSGVVIESRVDKVLTRHGLRPAEFDGARGGEPLETRLIRESLPPDVVEALERLRSAAHEHYAQLAVAAARVDPTLERSVQSARNAALAGTQEIEKKLVAALKRTNDALVGQLARARGALAPAGKPQERVLTAASFVVRYGPGFLDALDAEVARWAAAP